MDNGTLIPLMAACVFVLAMIIATVFRSKTKKFWNSYSARRYHIVDVERDDAEEDGAEVIARDVELIVPDNQSEENEESEV